MRRSFSADIYLSVYKHSIFRMILSAEPLRKNGASAPSDAPLADVFTVYFPDIIHPG